MRAQFKMTVIVGGLLGSLGCSAASDQELAGTSQALDVGGECVVADSAIEHSCAHANFGPYASVVAQAFPGFVFTDISAPHTAYAVSLPETGASHQGAALYSPGADGRHAFFTTPGASLLLLDASEQPVAEVSGAQIPAELCAQIDQVSVFELSSAQTYTVVFGPAPTPAVQVIIESIGEGKCDECASVHLDASLSLWPHRRSDAQATLETPLAFEVPEQLGVHTGQARVGTATLSFRGVTGPWVHCLYGAKPSSNAFRLLACSGGLRAGDDTEASRFALRLNPGAALLGPVTLELELEDEACHGHEHEGEE